MSMISEQVRKLRELARMNSDDTFRLLWEAAETIEDLSANVHANNIHNGWIPATESLPELPMCSAVEMDGVTHYTSDTVLVTTADGVIDMGFMEADENEEFGWDVAGFRVEVTAWMPLPDPWEGEDE